MREEIKNKIITISGEPVSGKSTAIKNLIESLVEQGYDREKIHLESTGAEFRSFFNDIVDFIAHIEDDETLRRLSQSDTFERIIKNPEYRAAFIETAAKIRNKGTDLSNFTVAQANNMEEFSEIRKIADTIIDTKMESKGKEINSEYRPDEIWIIDSRLAFHNIPDSFSVRLVIDEEEAGKRLMADTSRGKEDSNYSSLEEAIETVKERKLGEINRYKKRYGVDLTDKNNYDLIIDTSHLTKEEICDKLKINARKYFDNKEKDLEAQEH